MAGAPEPAPRIPRLPFEGVELHDARGSVGWDEQHAGVAALDEQRAHLLAVDADEGERAPEVIGAPCVILQADRLSEHQGGIETLSVLCEAVARDLGRVDEQVADAHAALELDGIAVDDPSD